MKGIKILLVEDSKISAMITTSLINSFDDKYRIEVVNTLHKAINKLSNEQFDIILLDLTLPDSSGYETFQSISDKALDIPIIILSGSNDEKVVLKAIENGAQDYLFKEELAKSSLRRSILYAMERHNFSKALNEKNKIIKENEKMFKEILSNYPDGIFLLDENKRILLTNTYGEAFFGKSERELLGSEFTFPINLSISSEIKLNIGNEEKIAEITAKKIKYGGRELFIVSLRDITEKKKLQEQLEFYATKDSLTGFYNRRYGLTLVEQSLKVAKRSDEPITLCFIDIDNLKYTNDTYGHPEGDKLIKTVSTSISSIVRDSDIVARLGGDEFLITFLNANIPIAKSILSRIEYKIYSLSKKNKLHFQAEISKGFAQYDSDSDMSLDKLISIADTMMYQEKMAKKSKKK